MQWRTVISLVSLLVGCGKWNAQQRFELLVLSRNVNQEECRSANECYNIMRSSIRYKSVYDRFIETIM